jgi:tape measure domain-containing protein
VAEIDPLIVELKAKVDQFERDLARATRRVEDATARQRRDVQRLEDQFRRSSGAIGNSLKGLAATLGASFSAQALVGLLDSYTRLQNSLRVAGLEGENLAAVQAKLFDLAAKNGTSVNSLADLYSKVAQSGKELGATQDQLLQITASTSEALRVSGVSAEQASGAILGLAQALAAGKVNAEDYAQVNEGGLRPLLQAAANAERFGGSVNKLRAEVYAGTLTSQDFFNAILAGSGTLRDQAANATLTLSGAVESLNARLIEYIGSEATASGATGLLSGAIQKLADNIDTVIEALAVIAAVMGVRYVAALGAAALASNVLLVRTFNMVGAMGALTVASRQAQAALLGAFTGPLGVAIGAVAAGMALAALNANTATARLNELKASTAQTAQEADAMEARLREAGVAMDNVGVASGVAESGIDGVSRAAGNAQTRLAALEQQAIRTATALVDVQLQENSRRRVELARTDQQRKTAAGSREASDSGDVFGKDGRAKRSAEAVALDEEFRQLTRKRNAIIAGVRNGVDFNSPAPVATPRIASGVPRASGTSTASRAPQGPDLAEVERRFLDELASIQSRIISANASRATSIEAQANAEREQLRLSEESALRSLAADEDLTDAQRAQLFLRLSELANAEREAINFRERAEIEQRNRDLADERSRAQIDGLRLQFDLADTEKDRRRIALEILDAEQAILRERLQQQVDNTTLSDAVREQARIALAALDAQAAAQVENTKRQFATPLERYADRAKDADQRIEEAVVRRVQDINETISNAFTNALGIKDPFLAELISIFLDKNIFGPLAEALSSGGGGFGGIGDIFGPVLSLFGRASGGPVSAGRVYRINEGASAGRVEAFVPNQSGQIIPLGRMNAIANGGASQAPAVATVRLELSGDIDARIQRVSGGVAVEVVRQAAPQIVDAASNETLRRANRPGL